MSISIEVNRFLRELKEAVDQYHVDDFKCDWFDEAYGVCDNWSEWTDHNDIDRTEWQEGREILKVKFIKAGLDAHFPFNTNLTEFMDESNTGHIWYNKKRLAWLEWNAA